MGSTQSLPIFVRLTGVPAMLVGTGPAADAKRRLLERAGARIVDESGDARLAIVALDDDEQAQAVVARLQGRGMLVNAVDRPALCDFTLPAIVDRDPVLIAIGTGGASAGLAKALRQRLEQLLPASLGALARQLQSARAALRPRFPAADDRRRAIDAALDPGGALDPLRDQAGDAVAQWLGRPDALPPSGLIAIALRSPDPDELTLREARLLGQADRIFHRADVPAAVLDRARADAERIACAQAADRPGPGLSLDLGWAA